MIGVYLFDNMSCKKKKYMQMFFVVENFDTILNIVKIVWVQ